MTESGLNGQRGFTLIELFIVVLIIAVLAAVAFPSYTAHVQSSRQAAVQGQLMDVAAALEAFRARNFSYNGAAADAAITSRTVNEFYAVTVTVPAGDLQSYTIKAEPLSTKNMKGTETFMINELGETCMKVAASCSMSTDPSWK
ncbi:MAG: prepilin-type cleavage/methylation domain-containing protein [Alcanivoracaceae bacterium]|nr:prepilin-type cleavage/methylation domain-containing protein [Alcanivoracaceae bacterium]|tara:strand:- start:2243 stop:2674 length:432 start_codon:yes stop_codon:yes gene_type:complete